MNILWLCVILSSFCVCARMCWQPCEILFACFLQSKVLLFYMLYFIKFIVSFFVLFFFFEVLVLVKPMWEVLTVQSDIILFIVGKMKLVLSDLICDS